MKPNLLLRDKKISVFQTQTLELFPATNIRYPIKIF